MSEVNQQGTLPHPCDGPLFRTWTPTDYLLKVQEEVGEMGEAYRKLREAVRRKAGEEELARLKADVAWEATDSKTAIEGFLASLGVDAQAREEFQKNVNASNATRDGKRRFRE